MRLPLWKKFFVVTLLLIGLLPALTFAAHSTINTNVWSPSILKGPLVICGAPVVFMGGSALPNSGGIATTISGNAVPTPPGCQDLCDLAAQIVQILYFIIGVGIWVVVPLMVGYAGVMTMIARGNPGKVSEARKAAIGAIIGVAIMLCAWIIVSTFVSIFKLTTFVGMFSGGGSGLCH